MKGARHLIQCHCMLPQYRGKSVPVFHKFIVFSIMDDKGDVIPKLAECNNCGVIHNIIDLCKSEIVHNVEDAMSIVSVDDIIATIPDVKFIYDNDLWGETVVIAKDQVNDSSQIKILTIKSESRVKIDSHIRKDEIMGEYQIR